jgi:hypothetical protein
MGDRVAELVEAGEQLRVFLFRDLDALGAADDRRANRLRILEAAGRCRNGGIADALVLNVWLMEQSGFLLLVESPSRVATWVRVGRRRRSRRAAPTFR